MKKVSVFISMVVLLSFASCGSVGNLNPLSLLTGNNWVLSSLMGNALDPSKFLNGVPSLSFLENGGLAGFTGCNNFNGNFKLDGSSLNLDPGTMTKNTCEGSGENDFLGALQQVSNLSVNKNKLSLLDGAKELMTFSPL